MNLPEIAEFGVVGDTAARLDEGLLCRETRQVTPNPGFASRQEPFDLDLGVRPSAPTGKRDRHHDAAPWIEGHPKGSRAGGAPEPVFDRSAGQFRASGFQGR